MMIKFLKIYFLLLPIIFAVIGISFYEHDKKKSAKRKLVVVSWFSCLVSIGYAIFIFAESVDIKIIVYNLCSLLLPGLFLAIFDFILQYYKASFWYKIISSLLMLIVFILYFCFPFTKEIYYSHNKNWFEAIYKSTNAIPVITFIIFNVFLVFTSGLLLKKYYIINKFERIRRATKLILIVSLLAAFLYIVDTILNYYILKPEYYYDKLMGLVLLCVISGLVSQKKYYFLDVEPNDFLLKMVDGLNQGFVITNGSLIITWCNDEFLNIIDMKLEDVLRKNITEIVFKNKHKDFFIKKSKLNVTGEDLGVSQNITILYTGLPIQDSNNAFSGGVYCFKDISNYEEKKQEIVKRMGNLQSEISLRTEELKKVNKELKFEMQAKTAIQNEIFSLISLDPLTQLYNRRYILEKLDALLHNPQVINIAVIFLDIDSFKNINSSHGYQVGDALLKQLAVRLLANPYQKINVARIGVGDFLLLLHNYTMPIETICSEIKKSVSAPFVINQQQISITASFGIARYPEDGIDVSSLMKFADMAVYNIKERGKNKIGFFDKKMQLKIERDFFIADELRTSIENESFLIYTIPQMNVNEKNKLSLYGFELIVKHKENSALLIAESEYLEVAESTGMIKTINRWCINKLCELYAQSPEKVKKSNIKGIIKISDKFFYSSVFVDKLCEIISKHEVPAVLIEIEISEKTLMLEPEKSIAIINELKKIGMTVSIYDFGLEYSSLNYLKAFNFDKIKISSVFISEIGKSKKDESIIQILILLASRLNLDIVAEGVCTQEQVDFLLANNCRKMQGDFFDPPMPVEQQIKKIEEFIDANN